MQMASFSDLDMLAVLQDEHLRSVMRHQCSQACNNANSANALARVLSALFVCSVGWKKLVWLMYNDMPAMQSELSVQCHTECWIKMHGQVFLLVLFPQHKVHNTLPCTQ